MSGFTPPSDPVVLVESNEEVAADFYRLRLSHPEAAGKVAPGQFVQLQVGGGVAPLLRVPLSVSAADSQTGTIEVLFEDMGPKTFLLSRAREGDRLRCLGPLGIGFPDPPAAAVLVGGGIGVPPLLFLGQRLRRRHQVRLLVGAREAAKLLPEELLSSAASEHRIATDDGSAGQRGFATDLLIEELDAFSPVTVYHLRTTGDDGRGGADMRRSRHRLFRLARRIHGLRFRGMRRMRRSPGPRRPPLTVVTAVSASTARCTMLARSPGKMSTRPHNPAGLPANRKGGSMGRRFRNGTGGNG